MKIKLIKSLLIFQVLLLSNVINASETVTKFPEMDTNYQGNYDFNAKVTYPFNDLTRVWVKGSDKYQYVTLNDDEKIKLSPPFYTELLPTVYLSSIKVNFFTSLDDQNLDNQVIVYPKDLNFLRYPGDKYSIAFYGCFQPFGTEESNGVISPTLYRGQNDFALKFLSFFEKTIMNTDNSGAHDVLNTRLLVGTGDQVYMDAGYEKHKPTINNNHPMSAWTVEEKPKLLRTDENLVSHVDSMYRSFGSFNSLNTLFRNLPQINTWDDHEIRDGWGSQGDEYVNGVLNKDLEHVFLTAKEGFIEHQFSLGSNKSLDDINIKNSSLHQTFNVGEFNGYALDLRSKRDSSKKVVLDTDQITHFEKWLDEQNNNQKIIIISTMPMFLKNNKFVESVGCKADKEVCDDLRDGWSSEENVNQRDKLMAMLIKARLRGIKPIIVSGDYHKGALSEIWFYENTNNKKTKKVLAYEMLASGVYHEGIAKGTKAEAFFRIEGQRVGDHYIKNIVTDKNNYTIEPYVKKSIPSENFGVVTFEQKQTWLKLYVGDEKQENIKMYSLLADWDKPYIEENEKIYGIKQNILNWISPNYWLGNTEYFLVPLIEPKKMDLSFKL
jgi:hypothetical protein